MKKYLALLFLFFFYYGTNAQNIFGNEWIKDNQKYLKIKTSEDGIYRISYNQLATAGFLSDNPNPKNFQLFYNGTEIPIYVEGEGNLLFENGEFIEFRGKKNDGKLDETLYDAGLQPNLEISLYSDEACYFLTIGTNAGKRYTNTSLTNNALTPEPYIVYTSSANFAETYYPGSYLIDVMSLSEYQKGEGYLGNLYGLGETQSRTLSTPNIYNTSSFTPTLSYYVAGRSDAEYTNQNGYNHHLRIAINNTTLTDASFKGYDISKSTLNLPYNLISSGTTTVNFSSINDLGAKTDYQAVSYARITYARSLDGANISYLPFKVSSSNTEALLNFTNTSWNEAYILDETNALRYTGSKSGTTTSFIVKNTANNILQVYVGNAYKTPTIENVTFNLIKASTFSAKLLIVTHKNLIQSANEYASYKISKGYSTLVVTTEDLYNQFYYGQHHPLAIKNLARYLLLGNTTIKPEYLLLLGKGYETSKFKIDEDLVPTMGFPASDSYLTSEITDNNLAPALATGRVPAKTNDDVRVYLNKLKQYDQQENGIWRKNIINITGGGNSSEDIQFSGYLKNLSSVASKEYFGASTINYYKSTTDPITDNLMSKISNSINSGVGLLSFLGHGSTTSTAVSIGNPSYLNNSNKLLVYIINGCSTGNAFVSASLGEDYIFQDNKGAIAWIGTSSEGVASYLYNYTNLLFQNSFNTNYGSSIAKNMARAARSYPSSDNTSKAHLRQYILLGDPTVGFYNPAKPDYEIKDQDIGLESQNVTANTPTIKLFAIIKNLGKATANNVSISVTRTLPNNTTVTYPIINYHKILNTDTVIVELDNSLPNITGNNKFTFTIDPNSTIDELSKLNNTATFNYVMQSTGVTPISPANYAITNESDIELKVQANDMLNKSRQYNFEIDTLITFNSSWKKTSPAIEGKAFATWRPNISPDSGKVYYWRAKQVSDTNPNNEWQTSSFTYIDNITYGWNQSHYQQYNHVETKDIVFNQNEKKFEFTSTAFPVQVKTKGNDGPAAADRRIRVGVTVGALSFTTADFEGLGIAAFDPTKTYKTYSYNSIYNSKYGGVLDANGNTGQFYFNTNNATDIDSLTYYLQNIPDKYYVVGFNGKNFNPKNLPQATQDLFTNLGLSKILTINNGEPYAFWIQKGEHKKITTLELTADYNSSTSATEQVIDFSYDLLYPWNNGIMTSEKIGPSTNWTEATFDLAKETSDVLTYSIIGVDTDGNETELKPNLTNPSVNLTDIPATTYPYIKLEVKATDTQNSTLPTFNGWRVVYDPYPDVSFNSDIANNFYNANIQQGDSLKVTIGLTNLEKTTSDSVVVKYKLTKADRSIINGIIKTTKPLAYGDSETVSLNYPTKQIPGNNALQLSLEPKDSKDKNSFNNYVSYDINVIEDKKEPIIEVYFDNKRIINGELVAPNPKISISIADESKYMLLTDTTNVELYLKTEDETNYRRIAFSDNKINVQSIGTASNNKIDFLYTPGTLADGRYTLKLRGKDVNGNYNTTSDYLINFEVINEQTITNFLPYPNPFTTAMKFVFQVTGKVPDNIKVQIMTVTGKIVREVFKNELGNINIGNNISDFTWDGTDQFGDRLANGVYFYNVIIENNDKSEIKHRANQTDAFFKKNFGKIYLMR